MAHLTLEDIPDVRASLDELEDALRAVEVARAHYLERAGTLAAKLGSRRLPERPLLPAPAIEVSTAPTEPEPLVNADAPAVDAAPDPVTAPARAACARHGHRATFGPCRGELQHLACTYPGCGWGIDLCAGHGAHGRAAKTRAAHVRMVHQGGVAQRQRTMARKAAGAPHPPRPTRSSRNAGAAAPPPSRRGAGAARAPESARPDGSGPSARPVGPGARTPSRRADEAQRPPAPAAVAPTLSRRELIAQRARAVAAPAAPAAAAASRRGHPARGARRCSNCGEPGHRAPGCPRPPGGDVDDAGGESRPAMAALDVDGLEELEAGHDAAPRAGVQVEE